MNKIQVNLWGEDLLKCKFNLSDRVLITGARTSDKYGAIQVNVNSLEGKVTMNPKGFRSAEKQLENISPDKINLISSLSK